MRRKYGTKPILSVADGVDILKNGVNSSEPFLAGRFGTSECNALVRYLYKEAFGHSSYGTHLDVMVNNAGFFPKDSKCLDKYCELVKELYSELDLLCIMNSMGEGYVVQQYCKNAKLTRLPVVDPAKTGWTSVLKGKRVLVVHPYEESIQSQYKNNRDNIYPGTDILPEFDLVTFKAVQTCANEKDLRFANWFAALDYMTDEIANIDFDVALIGCGAYGLPLGARIKRMGKKAVHMGGCLQLLFGIRGVRWDTRDYMQNIINDSWIRPNINETPKDCSKVEQGCYW